MYSIYHVFNSQDSLVVSVRVSHAERYGFKPQQGHKKSS